MFFAQGALVSWRKRHRRSYDLATLVGLWLMPPIISLQIGRCGRGGVFIGGRPGLHACRRLRAASLSLYATASCPSLTPAPRCAAECWRFVVIWTLYSSVTGYYLYRCSAKRLDKEVPKQVGASWRGWSSSVAPALREALVSSRLLLASPAGASAAAVHTGCASECSCPWPPTLHSNECRSMPGS